jgi:hypothetical protein
LRIVDLLADAEAGRSLASALRAAARRSGAILADFSCSARRYGEPLEPFGFRREETLAAPLPSRFQPLDFAPPPPALSLWASPRFAADSREFFAAEAAYVTRADADLDRPA